MTLFPDDPVESMELAKRMIGGHVAADCDHLAKVAQDRRGAKWHRIAAIYALGFVVGARAAPVLRGVLSDPKDDAEVRSYAAEALGNMRDRDAIMLLKDVTQSELRESCEYALGEL